jgi:hypothetical protein
MGRSSSGNGFGGDGDHPSDPQSVPKGEYLMLFDLTFPDFVSGLCVSLRPSSAGVNPGR